MLITIRVAAGGYLGLKPAQDRQWGEGCEVCGCLPRAGRVRSRLNGSEGLAVASRRSGEGLAADAEGWRLEKGDELPTALVALALLP